MDSPESQGRLPRVSRTSADAVAVLTWTPSKGPPPLGHQEAGLCSADKASAKAQSAQGTPVQTDRASLAQCEAELQTWSECQKRLQERWEQQQAASQETLAMCAQSLTAFVQAFVPEATEQQSVLRRLKLSSPPEPTPIEPPASSQAPDVDWAELHTYLADVRQHMEVNQQARRQAARFHAPRLAGAKAGPTLADQLRVATKEFSSRMRAALETSAAWREQHSKRVSTFVTFNNLTVEVEDAWAAAPALPTPPPPPPVPDTRMTTPEVVQLANSYLEHIKSTLQASKDWRGENCQEEVVAPLPAAGTPPPPVRPGGPGPPPPPPPPRPPGFKTPGAASTPCTTPRPPPVPPPPPPPTFGNPGTPRTPPPPPPPPPPPAPMRSNPTTPKTPGVTRPGGPSLPVTPFSLTTALPPGTPVTPKHTVDELRTFFWDATTSSRLTCPWSGAHILQHTIFSYPLVDELKAAGFFLDDKAALFTKQQSVSTPLTASRSKPAGSTSFLNITKANNILIMFRGCQPSQLRSALEFMDAEVMTAKLVDQCAQLLSKEDLTSGINAWLADPGNDPSTLSLAEQYVHVLASVPDIPHRLKVLRLHYAFREDLSGKVARANIVRDAAAKLFYTPGWRLLYYKLLRAGNTLNALARPGSKPAEGFKLSSLPKFADMIMTNKAMSLLDVAVEALFLDNPDNVQQVIGLGTAMDQARGIDLKQLAAESQELEEALGGLTDFLQGFPSWQVAHQGWSAQVAELKHALDEASCMTAEIASWHCESTPSGWALQHSQNFFCQIRNFIGQVRESDAKVQMLHKRAQIIMAREAKSPGFMTPGKLYQ